MSNTNIPDIKPGCSWHPAAPWNWSERRLRTLAQGDCEQPAKVKTETPGGVRRRSSAIWISSSSSSDPGAGGGGQPAPPPPRSEKRKSLEPGDCEQPARKRVRKETPESGLGSSSVIWISDTSTSSESDGDDASCEDNTKTSSGSDNLNAVENKFRYEEKEKLGSGGFGTVFAGYRKIDNMPVAIKHIKKTKTYYTTVRLANSTLRPIPYEVALMLKLRGTAAPVALLDWFETDKELILIMERPEPCMDLERYMESVGGHLNEDMARPLFRQIATAFADIHFRGVMHRDIKAENILIVTSSEPPQARIIDFGCGAFTHDVDGKTFRGTRLCCPPEWYMNQHYTAGPLTVYQLGLLLYVQLNGFYPFETEREICYKQPKIEGHLSQKCQDLLRRCLSKQPGQRPSLEELLLHPWMRDDASFLH